MTGRQLKSWMRRTGHTVQALAAALGVGERSVYRWRSGDQPIPRYIELALAALEAE